MTKQPEHPASQPANQTIDGKDVARKVAARMAKLWKNWEGTPAEFEAARRRALGEE
jgi:hypothetical protein